MRVFLAGHNGMVGRAIHTALRSDTTIEIITAGRDELDLRDQASVRQFMRDRRPERVIIAAAKVGGIHANSVFPAEFLYENLMIQTNIIHQAFATGVERLLFLGSSCIYPRDAAQPIREEALLSGTLEPTNEPYAIAKIAGLKLCESYNRQYGTDYRTIMPTNLYGPHDNFHPFNSHVVPALIRRIFTAQQAGEPQVAIWGSGSALREFMHVEDMARAALFVLALDAGLYQNQTQPARNHLNVGTGIEVTIMELAKKIAGELGFQGAIRPDLSRPEGTARKVLDVSRLNQLGWQAQISLDEGLKSTIAWFINNAGDMRLK